VKLAKSRYQSILIEGGVNFLSGILAEKLIDQFFLTRVNTNGDGNIFEERDLKDNYSLTSQETLDGLSFEIWEPNPQR
jgi:riboflavin biosynthesis pyrimidine reductase